MFARFSLLASRHLSTRLSPGLARSASVAGASVASLLIILALAAPAVAHLPHPCVEGTAGPYPCDGIDMERRVHIEHMGGIKGTSRGSDIWGWTHTPSGREFALMGMTDQTAFVEVTDPQNPVYLGSLASETSANNHWRDLKTYGDYVFIVADYAGDHGMQIFDLKNLLDVTDPPVAFAKDAHYDGFERAHNIVINEQSGLAFAVGSETCSSGLHIIDISTPTSPTFVSCFSQDGYTHDAQCVDYIGPDTDYAGSEICFNYNTDTLTLVDVTDPSTPVQIAREGYAGSGYTHQGWLTDDQSYLLLNDETDEQTFGHNTKTYIWDVRDLDAPSMIGFYLASLPSSDHNLYIRGNHAFLANYSSGLRIMDISDIANGNLTEVAYFDTNDSHNNAGFDGAWSSYPYFESGTVIVSDRSNGLFVLKPTTLCQSEAGISDLAATAAGDFQIDLTWTDNAQPGETYNIYRSFLGCPGSNPELIASGVSGGSYSDTTASGSVEYFYNVRKSDSFSCESVASNCANATTTGTCNAPPVFDSMVTVAAPSDSSCRLDLDWSDAASNCGGDITYSVYQTQNGSTLPGTAVRVASGLSDSQFSDSQVLFGDEYQYFVVAEDSLAGSAQQTGLSLASGPQGTLADSTWLTGAEIGDPSLDSTSGDSFSGGSPGTSQLDPWAAFTKHAGWHLSEARASSGSRSFFSQYSNNLCSALVTEPLSLTAGEAPTLSFWTVYDIELDSGLGTAWDGGVVEISTDGSTWERLSLSPDYPVDWRSSTDACGYATGSPAFSGQNLTWTEHTADLSPWAGQDVEIRWNFSTDGGATEEGWYVDDIAVSHVQLPSSCTSTSFMVFRDGFESGDFSGWSEPSP